MTWVKLDDDMPSNTKVRRVSVAARWVYVSGLCYASAQLSDGFIPTGALTLLDGTRRTAKELQAAGLWDAVDGGWLIHDYLKHNRSRTDATGISNTRSIAGAKGAANRWQIAKQNAMPVASDLLLSTSASDLSDLPDRFEIQDPLQNSDSDAEADRAFERFRDKARYCGIPVDGYSAEERIRRESGRVSADDWDYACTEAGNLGKHSLAYVVAVLDRMESDRARGGYAVGSARRHSTSGYREAQA